MASLAFLEAELKSLPAQLQPTFLRLVRELARDMRFGHPRGEQPDPCQNFGAGFFSSTTAAIANDEFSIEHTFGRTPYLALPALMLDTVGSRIVNLEVTRAADDRRIYLASPTTSAEVLLIVEG